MKRAVRNLFLLACACAAGWGASEWCYRTAWTRDAVGQLIGRGQLLALVRGVAIYEHDPFNRSNADAETLIVLENLRHAAGAERVEDDEIERELNLLRHQFSDRTRFEAALGSSRTSESLLRLEIRQHLQARFWIEKQIAPKLLATEAECRRLYDAERAEFTQPPRYRASHVFVAAPEGTPLEIMEAKRKAAKSLADRIGKGEPLAALATEASEDEATKSKSGDLGFLSAARALPEFFAEVEKLRIGQISPLFQSSLGFHIAQLMEVRPAGELTFEAARDEITNRLRNEKRAGAVQILAQQLNVAEFVRPKS